LSSTAEVLKQLIVTEVNPAVSVEDITDDTELLGTGVIDSMGIFTLVSVIEQQFHVEIPDEELVPENFRSVRTLAEFVDSRRSAS
jgi:acyl carrier protein